MLLELSLVLPLFLVGLFILYGILKIYQIQKYSTYISKKIDEHFASNAWKEKDIDFEKSYRLVTKAAAWNFNFESMIVIFDRPTKIT